MIGVPKLQGIDQRAQSGALWFFHIHNDSPFEATVTVRCSRGHLSSLDSNFDRPRRNHHVISDDGSVSPSVVCPHEGCDFHEFIKLEDWKGYGP
jgi:hypothetical protein